MTFPEDLRYTKEHEWIQYDPAQGIATVGITDFAQHELGDIVFIELHPVGSEVDRDALFGTVEAVKTVSELFMPVAGKIVEVNPRLDSEPELVNQDPYGEGWMVKLHVARPEDLDDLLDAPTYTGMVSA